MNLINTHYTKAKIFLYEFLITTFKMKLLKDIMKTQNSVRKTVMSIYLSIEILKCLLGLILSFQGLSFQLVLVLGGFYFPI